MMRIRLGTPFARRSLLQVGVLSGIGLSLADYLQLAAAGEKAGSKLTGATADAVVFLHLAGGPAHLDTLDMKPDAPAEERGEFTRIGTKIPGLEACEHLPKLAAA